MAAQGEPRITLVHDWLTGMRGGEKCLEILCQRWPDAPLYTLLHHAGSISPVIENRPVRASLLNWLPGVERYYRYLLPLMPFAVSALSLPRCELVVSFSHCVAKSIRPPRGTPHVCYCFTPMRYAWHMRQAYFAGRVRGLQQWLVQKLLGQLREWDRRTAARVTHFLAISQTVRERIRECYQREAEVIYPPVDTDFYRPDSGPREDYYLVVSAFAPYKRVDLAIRACERLGRRLVVIGSGQDRTRLQQLAGTQTHFLGWQPDAVIRDHLRRCKALLFPGEEDFGIVPVEAMSCGCPVIALGRGGAAETVIPPGRREEPTGLWFAEQSVEGLMAAVEAFERIERHFSPLAARRQALKFNRHRFREELFAYIDGVLGRRPCVLRRAA